MEILTKPKINPLEYFFRELGHGNLFHERVNNRYLIKMKSVSMSHTNSLDPITGERIRVNPESACIFVPKATIHIEE